MKEHPLGIYESGKDKLERVFSGEIRQTIRRGERYQVGDTLTIFEWTGTPYRSKWGRRIDEKVKVVFPIMVKDSSTQTDSRKLRSD